MLMNKDSYQLWKLVVPLVLMEDNLYCIGNIVICTNFSEDCSGDIGVGEDLTCNIENTVIETTVRTATLNVTKLVTCEDENGENSPSCADL